MRRGWSAIGTFTFMATIFRINCFRFVCKSVSIWSTHLFWRFLGIIGIELIDASTWPLAITNLLETIIHIFRIPAAGLARFFSFHLIESFLKNFTLIIITFYLLFLHLFRFRLFLIGYKDLFRLLQFYLNLIIIVFMLAFLGVRAMWSWLY